MYDPPPLSTYLDFTRDELIYRLSKVLERHAIVINHYYQTKGQELRAQVRYYQDANGQSITAIREAAKLGTHDITAELYVTKAELDQIEIERDFILLLLKEKGNGKAA